MFYLFGSGSLASVRHASNAIEFERPIFSASSEICTIYHGSSLSEYFMGVPVIHIESVLLPSNVSYVVLVSDVDVNHENFEPALLFKSRSDRGADISFRHWAITVPRIIGNMDHRKVAWLIMVWIFPRQSSGGISTFGRTILNLYRTLFSKTIQKL
jgi:hypothetical protein